MTRSFKSVRCPSGNYVVATITRVVEFEDGTFYFFAQNGDPKPIMCHSNQGGRLLPGEREPFLFFWAVEARVGNVVTLVREDYNPRSKEFTHAEAWAPASDLRTIENGNTLFTVIATNHRISGKIGHRTGEEEVVLEPTPLWKIIRDHPRQAENDQFGEHYKTVGKGRSFSRDNRWYRLGLDGTKTWVEDPRPLL